MKPLLYYTIILITIFNLFSCNQNENEKTAIYHSKLEISNIDNLKLQDTFTVSEVFKTIEYIPLETIEKSLLGSIKDIKTSINYIAIKSENSLFIFNKTGKFISKIKSIGKGPYEFLNIHNFQFKNDTTLAILDYNLEKVIEFSIFGDDLKELKIPQFSGQINYSDTGNPYIAFSYPDYFSNDFYFIRNLNSNERYIKFEPRENIDSESVRSMATTSLIHFYIDSDKIMEYWCFGINKILAASSPNQSNTLWDVSIKNKISGPIALNNKSLYFYILHKGGIVNFLYNKSSDRLKTFQYRDQSKLQMTIAFQNDLDEGPPFFPHFRTGIFSYANTLDYLTIESLKENNVFDPTSITNPELQAIFKNMQPNDNPVVVLAEKK